MVLSVILALNVYAVQSTYKQFCAFVVLIRVDCCRSCAITNRLQPHLKPMSHPSHFRYEVSIAHKKRQSFFRGREFLHFLMKAKRRLLTRRGSVARSIWRKVRLGLGG